MKHLSILLIGLLWLSSCSQKNTSTEPENKMDSKEDEKVDIPFTSKGELKAADGLEVTYDHLHLSYDAPVIVMCHQAGWSRGEYKFTADSLYRLGFNCIVLDQRSGDKVNDVENETAARAKESGLEQGYIDAEQDIVAALVWANQEYYDDIILMGSSYSASLALKIASEKADQVDRVISFSPGEYFSDFKLVESIGNLQAPCFLTSSEAEASEVQKLFQVIPATTKVQFIPSEAGAHGSKALWSETAGHQSYWSALKQFLGR